MSKRDYYLDNKGRVIGSIINETGGKKTVLDSKGGLLGRVNNGVTLDSKGALFGRNDQSMRLFK
jgi:hypothetical protein